MKKRRFSAEYTAFLCTELKLTVRSGISLEEAFAVMADEEPDKSAAQTLKTIAERLAEGEELQEVLTQAECFPKHVTDMIGMGYSTGYMEEVLDQLAKYYDREARLKESIRNAAAYPAVLLVMMLFVIGVLVLKVLPMFKSVFDQLGGSMSGAASLLMNAGIFIGEHAVWAAALAVIAAAAFAAFTVKKHREGCMTVFMTRRMQKNAGGAGFAAVMSMAVSSGFSIEEAAEMALKMEFDAATADAIKGIKNSLEEGKTFSETVSDVGIFPNMYNRMISLAERSGDLDTVLWEISERMDRTMNDELESLISKIEPALVITLSVLTGVILISVMLPLMDIMSGIG